MGRVTDGCSQSSIAPADQVCARAQALKPLLALVADSKSVAEAREAARLLGTVLAVRPAIADFLVGEGALPAVARLVLTGASLWIIRAICIAAGSWAVAHTGDRD